MFSLLMQEPGTVGTFLFWLFLGQLTEYKS
jgi:hypothetical protein